MFRYALLRGAHKSCVSLHPIARTSLDGSLTRLIIPSQEPKRRSRVQSNEAKVRAPLAFCIAIEILDPAFSVRRCGASVPAGSWISNGFLTASKQTIRCGGYVRMIYQI